MSLNLKPIKIAAAGLAVSLALGAAASADEVSFGYQKSELTTPAGAEKLYERINARAPRPLRRLRSKGVIRQAGRRKLWRTVSPKTLSTPSAMSALTGLQRLRKAGDRLAARR